MATRNFAPMKYNLPLICGNCDYYQIGESSEQYIKDTEFMLNRADELSEEFSRVLEYFTVEVKSGYYKGFQFYVEEKNEGYFDFDEESYYCIDEDQAERHYGESKEEVMKKAKAELAKIEAWLNGLTNFGFDHLICVATFSSGEAVYERVTV